MIDFARRFPDRYRFLLKVSVFGTAYGTALLSVSYREGVAPDLAPLLLALLADREKPCTASGQ